MSDMMKELCIANVIRYTAVDGHGLRMSIYTQGCIHNCKGCHNAQTHDPEGGHKITVEKLLREIKETPYISGVTLSGGDPLYQYDAVLDLCRAIKEQTKLNIVVYTGYTYEKAIQEFAELFDYIDFLVDGVFVEGKKSYDLYFAGSSNQRYIDVAKTKESGKVVVRNRFTSINNILEKSEKYRKLPK